MGKASGVLSSAIFIGLFAILIYFCCRVKRKGAVLQQRANNFDDTAPAGGRTTAVTVEHGHGPQPQHMPGGLMGYPQQHYAPPQHGVYGPTTMSNNQPYPPYSMNNSSVPQSNLPYPVNPGMGMPIPMPMPMAGFDQNSMQHSAPYPMAPSAPVGEDYDKPPSYESVIGGYRQH